MPAKSKYTDPKLRDEVKNKIQEGDKGGAPGQWSARKAQFMASEDKKRGGKYNTDKKDQDNPQESLTKWSEEDWQTKEGSGNAKQEDGTRKRYLPKKAWADMDEEEQEETDKKKLEESKAGKQFVNNTARAKRARQRANKGSGVSDSPEAKDAETTVQEEPDYDKEDDQEDDQENDQEDDQDDQSLKRAKSGQKRGKGKGNGANKKQKVNRDEAKSDAVGSEYGSEDDTANLAAQQGSIDRLPKKGQTAKWKFLPGWIEGTVVDIVREDMKVDGKPIKASKDKPKVVLKTNSSGKITVRKPESVYFH
ncbi:MAG: hypothetical protein Q9163_001069 [Psora crenata]